MSVERKRWDYNRFSACREGGGVETSLMKGNYVTVPIWGGGTRPKKKGKRQNPQERQKRDDGEWFRERVGTQQTEL